MHEPAEVVGREERLARAAPEDSGRDATGLRFLAVLREHAAELAVVPGIHDVGRRDAKVRVGTHVQRALRAEAEATLLVSELDRREAEVEKDPVELIEAVTPGHDVTKREVAPNEYRAISEPGKDTPRLFERFGVDVEPEKSAGWRAPIEDGLSVASPTDRAIEEAASFAGIKLGEYFGQKNRLMTPQPGGCAPRGPPRRPNIVKPQGP